MLLLVRNAVDVQGVFTRILLQFFEATINSFFFLRDRRSRDAFLFVFISFYFCPLMIKFQDGSEALWTNWKFLMTPLSRNSHKRLELKENQTKYRNMTRKPRSHFRILIYRAWAKANSRTVSYKRLNNRLLSITFQQLALVVLPDEFPKYHFSLSPLLRAELLGYSTSYPLLLSLHPSIVARYMLFGLSQKSFVAYLACVFAYFCYFP